jgi:hypothetical protein
MARLLSQQLARQVAVVVVELRQVRELVVLAVRQVLVLAVAAVVVAAQLQTMAPVEMVALVLFCLFTRPLQQPLAPKDQSLDKETK